MAGNPVEIGADVFVGPMGYITGGGNYRIDRVDIPIWRQGMEEMGGSRIADDCWLGARATVLGGVAVETGSVIGAGAVVTRNVAARSICTGVPARVVRTRGADAPDA
jgi:galactoside O-acetyltransferase